MGRLFSAVIFCLASLFITASVVFAVEAEAADYRQTVFEFENLDCRDCASRIREDVQRNDHTARILLDSRQKSLSIIHHKSISINQLITVFANHGISTKSVAQYIYRPNSKSVLPNSLKNSERANRTCGATKTAWIKLFQKHFR